MEELLCSGVSNWQLIIQKNESSVSILRAVTCDASAVLPDEVFGLPVTELADRALSPNAGEVSGDHVRITCGLPSGEFTNRALSALSLPAGLVRIGNYAFFNCRELVSLCMHDSVRLFGSDIFMNCRSFRQLELKRDGAGQGEALAAICLSLPNELDVTVTEADGSCIRLLFPEYYELHTENSPAHHFDYAIEGSGYPYHNVFQKKMLSLSDYDSLWPKFLYEDHDDDTALGIAWRRLRFPVRLKDTAKQAYLSYLCGHLDGAFRLALTARDTEGLRFLLDLPGITRPLLSDALEESRKLRYTEATALLLEKQYRSFSGGIQKNYDL